MKRLKSLASAAYPVLYTIGFASLFRYINRERILILAYHGVSRNNKLSPPHTLVPLDAFEEHMEYISKRYNVIPLKQAVDSLTNEKNRIRNAAVITFDDGYRNNYTVALPVLERYHVPATVFVTAGHVGSQEILPLDEAYVLITQLRGHPSCEIEGFGPGPFSFQSDDDLRRSCGRVASRLKNMTHHEQNKHVGMLRRFVLRGAAELDPLLTEDFRILSKEELCGLAASALIDIGAHTVNHQILTQTSEADAEQEIACSRTMLQDYTGKDVSLFAYPNGRERDYNAQHISMLRRHGFICSLTLEATLNAYNADPYRLGRIGIGPDFAQGRSDFALKTSGYVAAMKSFLPRRDFHA